MLQDRQRVQRQQKKAYLDYYNDLCLTMTRQFRSLSPSRLTRSTGPRRSRGVGTSSGCSHAFFLRTAAVRETVSPPRRKNPGPGGPGS